MKYTLSLLLACTFFIQSPVWAQSLQANIHGEKNEYPFILDLNWLNKQFLSKQRVRVEEITRKHFGQQLKIGKGNFALLQRIIDEGIIESDDKITLQALGVVLGDIYAESHKNLNWKVYEDEQGKSHAICIDKTEHCLFPVTMLSRRMEVGLKPQVRQVYKKGLGAIDEYLPKLPYSN